MTKQGVHGSTVTKKYYRTTRFLPPLTYDTPIYLLHSPPTPGVVRSFATFHQFCTLRSPPLLLQKKKNRPRKKGRTRRWCWLTLPHSTLRYIRTSLRVSYCAAYCNLNHAWRAGVPTNRPPSRPHRDVKRDQKQLNRHTRRTLCVEIIDVLQLL